MRQQGTSSKKHHCNRRTPKKVRLIDFTCIEEPHPYGVLPGGNRFFRSSAASSSSTTTSTSSIRNTNILSDKLWQHIICFCDGSTLGKLIQVNRYLYVNGHQPELWRDLVLRKCYSGIEKGQKTISKVGLSWKDTYVFLIIDNKDDKSNYKPHQPMKITGIYSDDIYRSHLCRSFAIPSQWLHQMPITKDNDRKKKSNKKIDTVPEVYVQDITPQQYFVQYEERNRPVIIKGAASGKACEKWKNWNYLMTNKPNIDASTTKKSYRATSGAAPLPGNFTLKAYHDYTQSTRYLEESPLYLFDRNALTTNKEWEDDFFPEFYHKCPYWNPSDPKHGHDLLQHLGINERPDHTWLIVGPKRSGSIFHIDPNATHAWNACITGRKRWIFYPPGQPPPGVFPSADGDEVALPLSVGEWIIQYWTEHMEQYRTRPVDQRPLECTTHPGDVVFVPHGWWHSVINLDDSNIAITHNYISRSNLGNALKFFAGKQDQISGCRDRKETIKPEYIHDEFVRVLKVKEPEHLEKALQQTGWTCRAWEEKKLELKHTQQQDDENEVPFRSSRRSACNNDYGNDFSSKNSNKKRRIDIDGERDDSIDKIRNAEKQELTSVMSKTERVSAFSFSFL
mmetsp:Transcript_18812/g.21815  ORF Transcript_18812/g.21815 Transcript_18812/m.21815 type:complete len:621 (-) Transcript_18812:25-1887(-)